MLSFSNRWDKLKRLTTSHSCTSFSLSFFLFPADGYILSSTHLTKERKKKKNAEEASNLPFYHADAFVHFGFLSSKYATSVYLSLSLVSLLSEIRFNLAVCFPKFPTNSSGDRFQEGGVGVVKQEGSIFYLFLLSSSFGKEPSIAFVIHKRIVLLSPPEKDSWQLGTIWDLLQFWVPPPSAGKNTLRNLV